MTLQAFNELDKKAAAEVLLCCCGSTRWVSLLVDDFPFASGKELTIRATEIWYEQCGERDWREAFSCHPKIGDANTLKEKFASTRHLTAAEQSGMQTATQGVIEALARANAEYEQKFGFIFIVSATGKTADEMLRLLADRLMNTPAEELHIAMGEQHKITLIRLKKLLSDADWQWMKGSRLTTHILNTATGKPAQDLTIRLQQRAENDNWQTFAQGITNADGRLTDLLPPERILSGNYKIVFETGMYFRQRGEPTFYPVVEIQFSVAPDQHYHTPLLISPYGYSTYRGS